MSRVQSREAARGLHLLFSLTVLPHYSLPHGQDFSMAFKPVSLEARTTSAGMLHLRLGGFLTRAATHSSVVPGLRCLVTHQSQRGCNNVLLGVCCRMRPQNDNTGHGFV